MCIYKKIQVHTHPHTHTHIIQSYTLKSLTVFHEGQDLLGRTIHKEY